MQSRFFFHLVQRTRRIVDRSGIAFDEDAVMSLDVELVMQCVWPGTAEAGWDGWSIEVVDQTGRMIRTIPLASPKPQPSEFPDQ